MNTTPFPALSAETLLAVNTVGQWLAQNDFSGEQPYSSDCVVLAGNAVIPTIDAACRIAKAQGVPLLISGGIGHSTPFLYAVIARHPRYHTIRTADALKPLSSRISRTSSGIFRLRKFGWKIGQLIAAKMPVSPAH